MIRLKGNHQGSRCGLGSCSTLVVREQWRVFPVYGLAWVSQVSSCIRRGTTPGRARRQRPPASQVQASRSAAAAIVRPDTRMMNPHEGVRGLGRARFRRPEPFGRSMPLLHSGHSKLRPAKPSGTRTVEPQMAQVRAGTGSLREDGGNRYHYCTSAPPLRPPSAQAGTAGTAGRSGVHSLLVGLVELARPRLPVRVVVAVQHRLSLRPRVHPQAVEDDLHPGRPGRHRPPSMRPRPGGRGGPPNCQSTRLGKVPASMRPRLV
jgi:hypothetical protein